MNTRNRKSPENTERGKRGRETEKPFKDNADETNDPADGIQPLKDDNAKETIIVEDETMEETNNQQEENDSEAQNCYGTIKRGNEQVMKFSLKNIGGCTR